MHGAPSLVFTLSTEWAQSDENRLAYGLLRLSILEFIRTRSPFTLETCAVLEGRYPHSSGILLPLETVGL